MQNVEIGVVWEIRGYQGSPAVSPFDTVQMTS